MSYAQWSSFAYYGVGDIVGYNGTNYVALQANTNVVPPTSVRDWVEFLPFVAVNSLDTLTGDVTFTSPNSTVTFTNNGQDIEVEVAKPIFSALASPTSADYGNSTFTIDGLNALYQIDVTSSTVVQASIQVPDQPNDQLVWLISTEPSNLGGGAITFNFASNITASSQLVVSYAILNDY